MGTLLPKVIIIGLAAFGLLTEVRAGCDDLERRIHDQPHVIDAYYPIGEYSFASRDPKLYAKIMDIYRRNTTYTSFTSERPRVKDWTVERYITTMIGGRKAIADKIRQVCGDRRIARNERACLNFADRMEIPDPGKAHKHWVDNVSAKALSEMLHDYGNTPLGAVPKSTYRYLVASLGAGVRSTWLEIIVAMHTTNLFSVGMLFEAYPNLFHRDKFTVDGLTKEEQRVETDVLARHGDDLTIVEVKSSLQPFSMTNMKAEETVEDLIKSTKKQKAVLAKLAKQNPNLNFSLILVIVPGATQDVYDQLTGLGYDVRTKIIGKK